MQQQRQTVSIAPQSLQSQQTQEYAIDFPLFRQRTDIKAKSRATTITRIAADGSSISLRHTRGVTYEQEAVELIIGREPIDTGNLDYSLGRGEYACGDVQFASLLALHARLLARATEQAGPLPDAAADQLLQTVSALKNGGQQRMRA